MNRWIAAGAATLLSVAAVLEASPPISSNPATRGFDENSREGITHELVEQQIVTPRKNMARKGFEMSRARVSNRGHYQYRTETINPRSRDTPYVTFRTYEIPRRLKRRARLLAWGRVNTKTRTVELGVPHALGVAWVPITVMQKYGTGLSFLR